jgi:tetratricopeptide (TPR) repeat protein
VAIVACALGVASKESAAMAPLLVLAYDRIFVAGSLAEALRRRAPLYLGLAASWVLLAVVLRQGRLEHAALLGADVSAFAYARTQLAVVAHYLRLAFWPHPLVLDYGWPLAGGWAEVAAPGVIVVGLAVATLWALRAAPALGYLGLAFFLLLAPTSSVVPIGSEIAAERRMYLPLAAVIAGVVVLAWRAGSRVPVRLGLAVLAFVAAALGVATVRRSADYATEVGIWEDTIAKRPENARARQNLSAALQRAGRGDDSLQAWAAALRLSPEQGAARFNEANQLYLQGRYADASRLYAVAAISLPHVARIRTNLGASLLAEGKREEAVQQFEEALRLDPNDEQARKNLAIARGDGLPMPPPAR